MATINGLELRMVNGEQRWYDPQSRTILSPSHSKAREADALLASQQAQDQQIALQLAQAQAPAMRDAVRFEREAAQTAAEQERLRRDIETIRARYPAVAQQVAAMEEAAMQNIPEEIAMNPDERDKEIRRRLALTPNYRGLKAQYDGMTEIINANPTMFNFEALSGSGSVNPVSSFTDGIVVGGDGSVRLPDAQTTQRQDAPVNMQRFDNPAAALQVARENLARLQSQIPAEITDRNEREAWARENGIEEEIVRWANTVNQLARQQPQGFTPEQIGITPPRFDSDGNQITNPLTPEQRGFVQLPDGSYRPGSAIGGVPGMDAIRGMRENETLAPEAPMSGIVADDQVFTRLPQGFERRAVGIPGGGTLIQDVERAPDAPRFGVFQNADGTWTGIGAQANRGGFATEEEARQWSIAQFQPAQQPVQPTQAPAETGTDQPVQSSQPQVWTMGDITSRALNPIPDAAVETVRGGRVAPFASQFQGIQSMFGSTFNDDGGRSAAEFATERATAGGRDPRSLPFAAQSEALRRTFGATPAPQTQTGFTPPPPLQQRDAIHRPGTESGNVVRPVQPGSGQTAGLWNLFRDDEGTRPLRPELVGGGQPSSSSVATADTNRRRRSPFGWMNFVPR